VVKDEKLANEAIQKANHPVQLIIKKKQIDPLYTGITDPVSSEYSKYRRISFGTKNYDPLAQNYALGGFRAIIFG